MKKNKLTIVINRPIKEVFEFTINPKSTPLWITHLKEEVADSSPPKLGTVYKNRGDSEKWDSYTVIEYKQGKLFTLKSLDNNYHVRYTYKELDSMKTEMTYFEWVEKEELEHPFTQITLKKLKETMERGSREEVKVDIEKFVSFHKKRVALLNEFVEKKVHGRLVFQISFLGFESLAKLLYPEESDSGKRFIRLLSTPHVGVGKDDAEKLYNSWRNSLIHQGFIASPWTTLEGWDEDDDAFLSFSHKLRSSVEFPPGSIVALYGVLIEYLDDFFKKTNTKEVSFS